MLAKLKSDIEKLDNDTKDADKFIEEYIIKIKENARANYSGCKHAEFIRNIGALKQGNCERQLEKQTILKTKWEDADDEIKFLSFLGDNQQFMIDAHLLPHWALINIVERIIELNKIKLFCESKGYKNE